MNTKREIRAKDVVADIRSGMSNAEIMGKYRISPKGLRSIFRKLLDARVIGEKELDGRISETEGSNEVDSIRSTPRCYPFTVFPIYDLDNLLNERMVHDITDKGLKIAGIKVELGQQKNFLVQAEEFEDVFPFTFEAECRWVSTDPDTGSIAGFEITTMTELGMGELRQLIRLFTICDVGTT